MRFDLPADAAGVEWSALRAGVSIHRFYGTADTASAALLRYDPGARVPSHRHAGNEHVFVLEGSQTDERGHYPTGAFVINEPGTTHSVWSEEGCLVLIIWERPIAFLPSETTPSASGEEDS